MDRILYCLTIEHDLRWTLAAAILCIFGLGTAFRLLVEARSLQRARRREVALLGAMVGGVAAFSTHFVAMQGYDAGGEVRYGVVLTLVSLALGVTGVALGSMLVMVKEGRLYRGLGGLVGLSGVAAMHFVGIAALQLPGRVIGWDPVLAGAAVAGGLAMALLTGAVVYGKSGARFAATCLCAALSIIILHFTAMSAMSVSPEIVAAGVSGPTLSASTMLAVLALMVMGIVAVAGAVAWMGYFSRSSALKQIREAIDAMPDGMAFYDADDRLVLWNNRYDEVNPELSSNLQAGMTFREIIQIGLDEGLYAEAKGREKEWIKERMASRRALSTMMEQRIAGDRWLRVADRRTAAGGIVTVCTDITDLKNDARALAEARDAAQAANAAKSQFLANMSHEIRTPLNGVIGVAQALANTGLSPTQTEMLELIQSSGRTLQVLLSDILDLARVESGRLELSEEAYDLGRAVRDAAQLYEASAREKGLQFFVEIAPEADCWIAGDVVRLKQILTNLVSNAVKFTTEGFVSLTAAPGPDQNGKPTLRFSVEDTGIGFDCQTRERLFSRFEQADGAITRKFGGSGLGLAISRQLAEMMGGELDCESEPGGGSAFILTVPFKALEAPSAVAAGVAEQTAGDGATVRVLLADDHPVNRRVVEMILAQADVALTSVEDGAQALQAMRDADYDLVLMDMQMPVMDGLTATREIRLHEAAMGLERTPVVMLTANALPEHVAAAEAAGADLHLAKPFDAAELLNLVVALPKAMAKSIAA
ncbi:signal transduction histidine kinase/CheY-like chemotaxis protein [Brevundimonas alba]|uniref:Sensory/regulatory protein RpfC n=1 Tax=Brevundimonas alba TaxID=74314 RepID=A0A7X6BPI4_9CAUL|nr:ATP-binding protein [Brevundimonas alba]NJC41810.1 signal transduction histidine kinase/CheY-like chemotaxis protein [Brevundimonas alba]